MEVAFALTTAGHAVDARGGDRVAGPVNREPTAWLCRGWNPCLSGQVGDVNIRTVQGTVNLWATQPDDVGSGSRDALTKSDPSHVSCPTCSERKVEQL